MSAGQSEDPGSSAPKLFLPKSSHHEEEGEGNWLVSYADMMTLLVGFFVILMSFSKIDNDKFEQIKQVATREFGGSYQAPFGDVSNRIQSKLEQLGAGKQFIVKQTPVGVEVSFLGTVFFATGSPDFTPEGAGLLQKLIPIIRAEPESYDLTIEGHTDDVPVSATADIRSNWELSSVRACRVLEEFEKLGFSKLRLTAIGYGDSKPIVPNRDASGNAIAENQSQNRRVVIKLIKPQESVAPETAAEAAQDHH